MRNRMSAFVIGVVVFGCTGLALGDVYQLVTGVAPGTSPGAPRQVFSTMGVPGFFADGQRLGGTPSAVPASYTGTGTPMFSTNQFGSLSFMFRRGLAPVFGGQLMPVMAIDYLGGPLLDLDGNAGDASRSLVPVSGQTPVTIPGSTSNLDLSFGGGAVTLNNFDVTANNEGFPGFGPEIAVTVNTMAGTQPDGSQSGPINPGADTRTGTVTPTGIPGVSRIENLGYEFWQDSISLSSSTAADLGTLQYLGELGGFRIERDVNGNFPTLAGQGLGTTLWPAVNASEVGNTFNTILDPPFATTTIQNGISGDDFTDLDEGGLPLTDFGGDLGAYLDQVVIPAIDPLSQSFVYLESAGFGINNSFDPVFQDTVGYDVVLIAQSEPIPEPTSVALLLIGGMALLRRRAS